MALSGRIRNDPRNAFTIPYEFFGDDRIGRENEIIDYVHGYWSENRTVKEKIDYKEANKTIFDELGTFG